MFYVINKEKVYAYIVSLFTIVTLFFMSGILNSENSFTQETSANIQQNTIQNEENKINTIMENNSKL